MARGTRTRPIIMLQIVLMLLVMMCSQCLGQIGGIRPLSFVNLTITDARTNYGQDNGPCLYIVIRTRSRYLVTIEQINQGAREMSRTPIVRYTKNPTFNHVWVWRWEPGTTRVTGLSTDQVFLLDVVNDDRRYDVRHGNTGSEKSLGTARIQMVDVIMRNQKGTIQGTNAMKDGYTTRVEYSLDYTIDTSGHRSLGDDDDQGFDDYPKLDYDQDGDMIVFL